MTQRCDYNYKDHHSCSFDDGVGPEVEIVVQGAESDPKYPDWNKASMTPRLVGASMIRANENDENIREMQITDYNSDRINNRLLGLQDEEIWSHEDVWSRIGREVSYKFFKYPLFDNNGNVDEERNS